MNSFFRTLDAVAGYSNMLGFLAANALVNNQQSASCTPVIAAVVRDLKQYMRLKSRATGHRIVPIGYGAATTDARDRAVFEYLSSGDKVSRIDFWTAGSTIISPPER